jgi:hypothetical protein
MLEAPVRLLRRAVFYNVREQGPTCSSRSATFEIQYIYFLVFQLLDPAIKDALHAYDLCMTKCRQDGHTFVTQDQLEAQQRYNGHKQHPKMGSMYAALE